MSLILSLVISSERIYLSKLNPSKVLYLRNKSDELIWNPESCISERFPISTTREPEGSKDIKSEVSFEAQVSTIIRGVFIRFVRFKKFRKS